MKDGLKSYPLKEAYGTEIFGTTNMNSDVQYST